MAAEKRHPATEKKRKKARREGKVLKSPLLTQLSMLSVCFLCIFWLLPFALVKNKILLEYLYSEGISRPEFALHSSAKVLFLALLVLLAPALLAGILAELAQLKFNFQASCLGVKLERLDPVRGLAGIMNGLKQSWQFLLRLLVFFLVFYWFFKDVLLRLAMLLLSSAPQRLEYLSIQVWGVAFRGFLLLGFSALIEYWLRYRQHSAELRMSDEELKREIQEEEGNPLLKGSMKAMHESLLMQELTKRVRASRVVIVEKTAL